MGALTMLKALPLSYNRDLQEDKVFLFDGLDTTVASVRLMHRMLVDAQFRAERMARALAGDFSNATDLADYLVPKGVPFRQCHEIVGKMVRFCIDRKIGIEDMTLEQMKGFSPLFEADALEVAKHSAVMRARTSRGGTGPSAVQDQIARAKKAMT